ncbi:hypothetical protein ColLi_03169 [Colletotrichum liriopes]|uniref:Uncharacterized protein n=1 Tax=Colletotrichum liriopes TaxID=708192 RepID=A0AA37GH64_9PEZI|nr:hypothetical protein ColLi_03169 [Colletotrichum liriopes]
MCQLCPGAFPSRYNSRGELEEAQVNNKEEEEEEEGEYCPPSPPSFQVQKTIVQPAPSHDGAPIFAAYEVPAITPETEAELRPRRPPFALVVYDATHTARPTRSARLARALFDRTISCRRARDSQPDRIEVVTLPLPPSFSDDERVEACIRHHEEEFQSRLLIAEKAEAASWFLPERIMDRMYARKILAVNCFEDDSDDGAEVAPWEEALHIEKTFHVLKENPNASRFGSYLEVEWQPRKQQLFAHLHPKYAPPGVTFHSHGFAGVGDTLFEMVQPAVPFYKHFVPDGVLNRQLEEARKAGGSVTLIT